MRHFVLPGKNVVLQPPLPFKIIMALIIVQYYKIPKKIKLEKTAFIAGDFHLLHQD